ncbi:MAG: hypothetical protein ACLQME_04800 [Alphaproteobacteria bacterium]
MPAVRNLLTVPVVAKVLECSERTALNFVHRGRLEIAATQPLRVTRASVRRLKAERASLLTYDQAGAILGMAAPNVLRNARRGKLTRVFVPGVKCPRLTRASVLAFRKARERARKLAS